MIAVTRAGGLLRCAARHPFASVAIVVLVGILIVAVFGPALPGGDAPRLVSGARNVFIAGLLGVGVAVSVGTVCGLAAGVYLGPFDRIAGWLAYLMASVPACVFLVVLVADSSNNIAWAMIVFGVLMTAPFFALARSTVMRLDAQPTLQSRRLQGLTTARLIVRFALPALRLPLLARALLVAAFMVSIDTILTFLGLVSIPTSTWGSMLRETGQNLPGTTELNWTPGVLLALTVISLATVGLSLLKSQHDPGAAGASVPVAVGDGRWSLDEPLPSTWFRAAALLDVRGLRIRFDTETESQEIASGVSLTIGRGEVVGLLGDAESGAREIALAIAGLLPPKTSISGGSILFGGAELVGLPERLLRRTRGTGVSYLPPDPLASLEPAFTVASHLQTPLRKTLGLSRDAATARSLELLRRVGFSDPRAILALRPPALTSIMAERVLIAGAISCDPDLVIANEPTATLSGQDEAVILALLHSLQQELDLTVIVVTHRLRILAATCRQVAVVQAGMIVEHSSIADLFDEPQHPYTRHLLSAEAM